MCACVCVHMYIQTITSGEVIVWRGGDHITKEMWEGITISPRRCGRGIYHQGGRGGANISKEIWEGIAISPRRCGEGGGGGGGIYHQGDVGGDNFTYGRLINPLHHMLKQVHHRQFGGRPWYPVVVPLKMAEEGTS